MCRSREGVKASSQLAVELLNGCNTLCPGDEHAAGDDDNGGMRGDTDPSSHHGAVHHLVLHL